MEKFDRIINQNNVLNYDLENVNETPHLLDNIIPFNKASPFLHKYSTGYFFPFE